MLGVQILIHAIGMVVKNIGDALRLTAVPMLTLLLLTLVLGGTRAMLAGAEDAAPDGAMVLLSLLQMGVTLWIAVAWHRFILLGEGPEGILPPLHGRALVAYLWAGVIFALLLVAVAVPFGALAGLIVGPMIVAEGGAVGGAAALLLFLLLWLPIAYVSYRISPILPSAAIGDRLPVKEAWYATGTGGAAFIVLAFASILVVWGLNMPVGLLVSVSIPLAFVWAFAVQWAVMLGAASVLTTIYGHFVEKRELDA